MEYLVKWKNFDDPDDNTWEPSDNLGDAEDKIKKFEKDLEAKSSVAAKKESVKRKATGSPAPRADKETKVEIVFYRINPSLFCSMKPHSRYRQQPRRSRMRRLRVSVESLMPRKLLEPPMSQVLINQT